MAVLQAMSEAAGSTERNEASIIETVRTRTSGPAFKQLTFNWKAQDKYNELLKFDVEVKIYS